MCGPIGVHRGNDSQALHAAQSLDSLATWDDSTARFWCPTQINAYDLPEATAWQEEFSMSFKEVVREAEAAVEFVSPPGCQMKREESPSASEAPSTPVRRRRPQPFRFAETPPKSPPKGSSARATRAAHTRALMTMKQSAGMTAVVQGRELAFFRFGGRVFAVDARCPHQGGQLASGEVGDIEDMATGRGTFYITCPVHKMRFDLASGKVLEGHCPPLRTYDVRIGDVDEERRTAFVHVGFTSLADSYFGKGRGEESF